MEAKPKVSYVHVNRQFPLWTNFRTRESDASQERILVKIVGEVEKFLGEVQQSSSHYPHGKLGLIVE
jgi:hypothetical protein